MSDHLAITWQEVDAAGFMSLGIVAGSEEARQFVEGVLEDIIMPAWPEGMQKRRTAIEKHRKAIAVFFGELQRLDIRNKLGKRGMADKNFVGAPFGRDVFRRTADALGDAGLLNVRGGWRWTRKNSFGGGEMLKSGSTVTTFGLTEAAFERLDAHRVAADRLWEWRRHWSRPENSADIRTDAPLVERKPAKAKHSAVRQARDTLPVDLTNPKVARISAELEAHNAFMARVGVEGAMFFGLKRVFNDGDQDGFEWQWGGRFASRGPSGYETEAKSDRLENMRIGGEPVVEVDIRASHLTILYALSGYALDPEAHDPYAVDGIDRELVKRIVTQAIGRGNLKASRWSDDARDYYAKANPGANLQRDFPYRTWQYAVTASVPALGLAGAIGRTVHDLNFHEAEVMTRTMALLRSKEIGSLPVHDCLIVPASAEEAAKDSFRQAFLSYFLEVNGEAPKVIPALTVER